MRDIQREGTPTRAAPPASSPKTRRRVIGTGRLLGMIGAVRHHRYMGGAAGKGTHRRKWRIFKGLPWQRRPATLTFLDFRAAAAFNPATFSERLSFRPAHWSQRPEANARQRDAPSGVKVFGRLLAQVRGHPPRRRRIQYPRGGSARTGKPRRTGCPGQAGA